MKYFDRLCAVTIGDNVSIEDHKIKFEIQKSIISTKNSCRVDIYNLSQSTRDKITQDVNTLVRVAAGYVQNGGLIQIAQGYIMNIIHLFKSPDVVTTVYCIDGFAQTRNNNISLAFAENTSLSQVIDTMIKKLGLPVRFTEFDNVKLDGGYSFTGNIKDAFEDICRQFQLKWSIQNGTIQIVKNNRGTTTKIVHLNAASGLIENPEKIMSTRKLSLETPFMYKVTSLLQPQLEAGDQVSIESKTINGTFIVKELWHKGDTRGNDFITQMFVMKN